MRTTFYSKNYTQTWPPVPVREFYDANSSYWQRQAQATCQTLANMLGDDYAAFAEATWPGDAIDGLTWRQIYDAAESALVTARAGERDVLILAAIARSAQPILATTTA